MAHVAQACRSPGCQQHIMRHFVACWCPVACPADIRFRLVVFCARCVLAALALQCGNRNNSLSFLAIVGRTVVTRPALASV